MITGANVHDSKALEEIIDSVTPVKGKRGRPRKRPDKLHADKGYDHPQCRWSLRKRGIKPRIARKAVESSERLGRWRWVVERTFSWISRYRRLVVRYERRANIHEALPSVGVLSHLPLSIFRTGSEMRSKGASRGGSHP